MSCAVCALSEVCDVCENPLAPKSRLHLRATGRACAPARRPRSRLPSEEAVRLRARRRPLFRRGPRCPETIAKTAGRYPTSARGRARRARRSAPRRTQRRFRASDPAFRSGCARPEGPWGRPHTRHAAPMSPSSRRGRARRARSARHPRGCGARTATLAPQHATHRFARSQERKA